MQLGWIDFSKEDRQKALDVINLLSEQGEHLQSRPERSIFSLFHISSEMRLMVDMVKM